MNKFSYFLTKYFFSSLFLLGIIVFHKVFVTPHLFDIDRPFILDVFESQTVIEFLKEGLFIYDVALLRDVILFLLGKIKVFLNFQVYGFFNYLLWFGSLSIFFKAFQMKRDLSSFLFLALLLCHPMLTWVISWPTAIKHLLSLFFSGSFLYFAKRLETQRVSIRWGVFFSYLFLLNSWPINILLPACLFFLLDKSTLKKNGSLLALLGAQFVLYLVFNYFYFSEVYPLFTFADKFTPLIKGAFAQSLLGFSRGLTQVLIPLKFSIFYSPQSMIGLLGGILFFPLCLYSYFRLPRKRFLFFMSLIMGPFIVVYSRPTNVFVSDPYYLLPLVGIGFLLQDIADKKIVAALLLFFFIPKSLYESSLVTDPFKKLEVSYQRESGCKNGVSYAAITMREFKIDSFMSVARDLIRNKCLVSGSYAPLLTKNIYAFWAFLEPNITREDKKKILKPRRTASMVQTAIYLKLLNQQNDIDRVIERLEKKEKLPPFEKFVLELLKRKDLKFAK